MDILPIVSIILSIAIVCLVIWAVRRITAKDNTSSETERMAAMEMLRRENELMKRDYEGRMQLMQDNFQQRSAEAEKNRREQADAMVESQRRQLEELRDNQRRQIEMLKESQQQQIDALKESQRHQMDDLREQTKAEFRAMSQELIQAESERLSSRNTENIEALLNPFKEKIESFQKLVRDNHDQENAARNSLMGQIESLMKLNQTIGEEARNLTSALKNDSKVQGDWGEMVLQTLLEQGGLEKGVHFQTQVTRDETDSVLKNEEGDMLRPDVLLYLPDNKTLVIDSKVSLKAFADYCAADDEGARKDLLKKHIASVRRHIDELCRANYTSYVKNACDHTLMFIPTENAYLLAVKEDPALWKYAYEKHVAIVSPTHLFSVVQLIGQLWTQDAQNRNVLAIAEEGGKLYDKFVLFCDTFTKLEKNLKDADRTYGDAMKHLVAGKGNLVGRAEKLRALGAKVKKRLPEPLLARTDSIEEDAPAALPEPDSNAK